MPDGIIRLLGSLKLFAPPPDGWFSRRGAVDPAPFDRAEHLRRAFPLADARSVDALAAVCSILSVPGGGPLILTGEEPEAVYIVVAGLFAAYRSTANGGEALLDRYGVGDVIGDVGVVTGETRTATIRALRNSEVLRISKPDLQGVAARLPSVLLTVCSRVIQRLRRPEPQSLAPARIRTLCFVPADSSIDIRPIIEQVAHSLEAFGTVTILSPEQTSGRTSGWFSEIERCFDFVLFDGEPGPTAWTRFCLRQSDRVVVVAQGNVRPLGCPSVNSVRADLPQNTPLSLMLLWQNAIVPARTTEWLQTVNPAGHHHIRSSRDIGRASRLIAGRGAGLVLSGGGAKGLAHVGVIDALRKHDIQIDAVGGTSIGGIVAAVFAQEWDLAVTVQALAAGFNRRRFSDFAVPRTALYSDRAFARTLGRCFGDITIEDSPIPLFVVSTNLTQGVSAVHRTGRLMTWLRATSAVPGICPPIVEQNAIYVDGGVLNNMPTDVIQGFGVASAIAVDVGTSLGGPARLDGEMGLPNIWELLWRVGTIGSDVAASRLQRDGDIVLKPEMGNIGLFDWNAHERAIAAGHQAVARNLDKIKEAIGRIR